MSEEPPQYKTNVKNRDAWRTKIEAEALRHVDNLAGEDRAEAIEQLDRATHRLVMLVTNAKEAWTRKPECRLADIALCLDDPALDALRDELEAADALDIVTGERRVDPFKAEASFKEALQDHAATKEQMRLERADKLLQQAKDAPDHRTRTELTEKAVEELNRRDRETEAPLSSLWQEYAEQVKSPSAFSPTEAIMLDASRRGHWARWFNRWLGSRGGLAPGTNVLIGGAPGGGKTSMGAALAVDAMAAGCPVTFWQLELGVARTLEQMLAQDPAIRTEKGIEYGSRHHDLPWAERAPLELPDHYSELLTIPRWPSDDADDAAAAVQAMASRVKRMRREGKVRHECNGVFIVDYVQRLRMRKARGAQASHEVWTDAVSKLAKTAEECGAVIVFLSQRTKASRNTQKVTGTEFAGADFERIAYSACVISKGRVGEDGEEIEAASGAQSEYVDGRGQPRLIEFSKMRGVMFYEIEDKDSKLTRRHPASSAGLWFNNFAVHGDDGDFPMEEQELKTKANKTKRKQGKMPF
jgi:hypothetical protein